MNNFEKAATAAYPVAREAGRKGAQKFTSALDAFEMYVQQGPDGIRFLSFIGGLVVSFYGLTCAIGIGEIFSNPVAYIAGAAQLGFGLMIVVLEASPSLLASYQKLATMQRLCHDYCKFLTLLWGRGIFYLYVGAHIILLSHVLSIGGFLGAYMLLMGVFYLSWYWGYDVSKTTGIIIDKLRGCIGSIRGSGDREEANYTRFDG